MSKKRKEKGLIFSHHADYKSNSSQEGAAFTGDISRKAYRF